MRRAAIGSIVGVLLIATGTAPARPYVRSGVTERVSVTSAEQEGNGSPENPGSQWPLDAPSISTTGRYVAYSSGHVLHPSQAPRVPAVPNRHIFLRDRLKGTTRIVSVDSVGALASNRVDAAVTSESPSVSKDGRFVAFHSDADSLGLVARQGAFTDIYVRDVRRGETELLSRAHNGLPSDGPSNTASISDDGRFVAFASTASNLTTEPDLNLNTDIYLFDRKSDEITRVTVQPGGDEPQGGSSCPSISRTGRFVLFRSDLELTPDDTNLWSDVYVYDHKTGKTELVSWTSAGELANFQNDCGGEGRVISDNGRFVVFHSGATNMVPNDTTGLLQFDTFVRDRVLDRTERVSVTSWGAPAADGTAGPAASISSSGRFVTFENPSTNLDDRDGAGTEDWDVFVHDRGTGATTMASVTSGGEQAPSCRGTEDRTTWRPVISGDGRWIAFNSCSPGLVPGDRNNGIDTFVRDAGRELGVGHTFVAERSSLLPGGRQIVTTRDPLDDAYPLLEGSDVVSARVAYRPGFDDLYVKIDLDRMPGPRGGWFAGDPTIVYGMRFVSDGTRHELRAVRGGPLTGSAEPVFGLFRCDDGCKEIERLRGGYGTVGESIVITLPRRRIGERIRSLEVFAALGTYHAGVIRSLDTTKF